MYVHECFACMYVCTSYAHAWLLRPEEPIRCPGSGVRVSCQPHVDSGNQTVVLYESSKCFKPWAISPGPQSPPNCFLLFFLKPGMVLLSPVLGGQGQEDPWGLPASPPNLTGVPGQWETITKKPQVNSTPKNDAWGGPLTFVCIQTHDPPHLTEGTAIAVFTGLTESAWLKKGQDLAGRAHYWSLCHFNNPYTVQRNGEEDAILNHTAASSSQAPVPEDIRKTCSWQVNGVHLVAGH